MLANLFRTSVENVIISPIVDIVELVIDQCVVVYHAHEGAEAVAGGDDHHPAPAALSVNEIVLRFLLFFNFSLTFQVYKIQLQEKSCLMNEKEF
jgi:hypothetical protein